MKPSFLFQWAEHKAHIAQHHSRALVLSVQISPAWCGCRGSWTILHVCNSCCGLKQPVRDSVHLCEQDGVIAGFWLP